MRDAFIMGMNSGMTKLCSTSCMNGRNRRFEPKGIIAYSRPTWKAPNGEDSKRITMTLWIAFTAETSNASQSIFRPKRI